MRPAWAPQQGAGGEPGRRLMGQPPLSVAPPPSHPMGLCRSCLRARPGKSSGSDATVLATLSVLSFTLHTTCEEHLRGVVWSFQILGSEGGDGRAPPITPAKRRRNAEPGPPVHKRQRSSAPDNHEVEATRGSVGA